MLMQRFVDFGRVLLLELLAAEEHHGLAKPIVAGWFRKKGHGAPPIAPECVIAGNVPEELPRFSLDRFLYVSLDALL
eukprot:COSAG06_NODE_9224_length_1954_cov_2.362803_3_plen_76_part_01